MFNLTKKHSEYCTNYDPCLKNKNIVDLEAYRRREIV